jgi:hypothetical protein
MTIHGDSAKKMPTQPMLLFSPTGSRDVGRGGKSYEVARSALDSAEGAVSGLVEAHQRCRSILGFAISLEAPGEYASYSEARQHVKHFAIFCLHVVAAEDCVHGFALARFAGTA